MSISHLEAATTATTYSPMLRDKDYDLYKRGVGLLPRVLVLHDDCTAPRFFFISRTEDETTSMEHFTNALPRTGRRIGILKHGGKVELNYDIGMFANACATRISQALNGAGGAHAIPFIKDIGPSGKSEAQASSGKNGMWFIFRVKILVKHLTGRYGKPESFTPAEYVARISGRKGIIVFEVSG